MATHGEFRSGACEGYEALLEDYLNGELAGADAERASSHVRTCDACRTALEHAAPSTRLLRAAEPSPDPGPGFARVVTARISSAEKDRVATRANFWQPFVSFGWRFAATATLAVMALVTYDAGWIHKAQPTVVSVRPTEGIDIFAPEPAKPPANGDEVLMMVADSGHEKH